MSPPTRASTHPSERFLLSSLSLDCPGCMSLPLPESRPAMANASLKPLCPVLEQMSQLQAHGNSSLRYMDHASVTLHGLAALLGLAENGLIVFVVGCRMRQTVVTTWALHLALSDLLACASLPFFTYFLAVGHSWELGTAFCKLHSSVFFLNMFASGFLLSAISLDRCMRVVRPASHSFIARCPPPPRGESVRAGTQVCTPQLTPAP
ncbi:Putative G-protein coupled receptor 44 [Fukomys damarensis]|uniref:Putative G-protein coupled receptor 44 n=1 Tax=Fukomys damarensis TaxID=885580 RepID=A0A091DBF9_FUKDA|nr:Putative G-protein coupled receptor 44 [Fukomys damarensis]